MTNNHSISRTKSKK